MGKTIGTRERTSDPVLFTVAILRECFRHLQAFRSVYESEGIDTLIGPEGEEICLWDLEALYDKLPMLPTRQHQAIVLFLVHNIREDEVAVMMGLSPTNPIGMYASLGLERLMRMIEESEHRAKVREEQEVEPSHL